MLIFMLYFLGTFMQTPLPLIFCFLGRHPWHMEVSRPGGEPELQLLAQATATAMLGSKLRL